MNREIAIIYCDEYLARHISDIDKDFLKKAKEALQQEPCSNCCNGNQIEKAKLCQKSYLAGMEHKQELCDKCVYSTSEGCQYDDITETIPPFDDCISRQAVIRIAEQGQVQGYEWQFKELIKLPPVTPQQKTDWIPVSKKLPKPYSYVNCTLRSLIDDRASWVVETFYLPQPKISPYSDWGNIPMLNCGKCEVVAWMYREIPEPYGGADKK